MNQRRGQLLGIGRGMSAANPITTEIDLMLKLKELCGAEGMRIEGGTVVALRYDLEGNEKIIDRFELKAVQG